MLPTVLPSKTCRLVLRRPSMASRLLMRKYNFSTLGWVFCSLIFILLIPACGSSHDEGWKEVSKNFVEALLAGNEEDARKYLSRDFRYKVEQECPDGYVTSCVEKYIQEHWGEFNGNIFLEQESDRGASNLYSTIFGTGWSKTNNRAVWIVIDLLKENDQWVVSGWRGFVITGDENVKSNLLLGTDTRNSFSSD